jgi:hypothetical protein
MTKNPKMEYRSRMGFSWFGDATPYQNTVSLTVHDLATWLENIAHELHAAYRNPKSRSKKIVSALTLLDLLQAEID